MDRKFARLLLQGGDNIGQVSEFLRAADGAVKIEDVLPLFPDFARIDTFKGDYAITIDATWAAFMQRTHFNVWLHIHMNQLAVTPAQNSTQCPILLLLLARARCCIWLANYNAQISTSQLRKYTCHPVCLCTGALCDGLADYNAQIQALKAEMEDATRIADALRSVTGVASCLST